MKNIYILKKYVHGSDVYIQIIFPDSKIASWGGQISHLKQILKLYRIFYFKIVK